MIIPARGGSKGTPRKNIRDFCGKPLIANIIEIGLMVRRVNRIIVSTDDEEIATIAKKFGAEVPFIRPPELAQDNTPTLPVLQHAVRFLERKENYHPDIIILGYPTAPLLNPKSVEEAIHLFDEKTIDTVIGFIKDYGHFWLNENGKLNRFYPKVPVNRQYATPLLRESGTLYAYRYETLMKENKHDEEKVGIVEITAKEAVDIDTNDDFERAELLKRQQLSTKQSSK